MPRGKPNKRYTPEFKIMVVETMHKEGLSYREAERRFDLPDKRAADWERIYLEEGKEGLYVERRGRKSSTGRPPKLKNLEKAVVCGKYGLCLGHFLQLAVKAFYGIGRIDQLS